MKVALIGLMILVASPVLAQKEARCTEHDGIFLCCADGENITDDTVLVRHDTDAFTDEAQDTIGKRINDGQMIFLIRWGGPGGTYNLKWIFPENKKPVFIIDAEHKILPGRVRFGKLEASAVSWRVEQTTTLAIAISQEQFSAAREGLAIQVENTWLEPSYQHILDFSCPDAWKMVGEP